MPLFGGAIYLVQTVDDVAVLKVRNPEHVAFVTQTTLSVDDTASIVAALRAPLSGPEGAGERGHLLCNAKSPGRGEGLIGPLRGLGGGRSNPAPIPIDGRGWRTKTSSPATWSTDLGFTPRMVRGGQNVGVTAALRRLRFCAGRDFQLRQWAGKSPRIGRAQRNT